MISCFKETNCTAIYSGISTDDGFPGNVGTSFRMTYFDDSSLNKQSIDHFFLEFRDEPLDHLRFRKKLKNGHPHNKRILLDSAMTKIVCHLETKEHSLAAFNDD